MAEIAEAVARRRAAPGHPTELLEKLHAEFSSEAEAEPPETLALIQASRQIRSSKPVLGRAIVTAKKVTRRLLAWYVHPIAEDQTRFNDAIVRELRSVERRLGRVETVSVPPAWWGAALAEPRSSSIAAALDGTALGPVLVIGADAALRHRLTASLQLTFSALAPFDVLEATPSESLSAVVLAGLLPRLSAAELLTIIPAASSKLRPDGRLICDFPDGDAQPNAGGAAAVDPTMQRWLSRATVELLIEAADLRLDMCDRVEVKPVPWLTMGAHPATRGA